MEEAVARFLQLFLALSGAWVVASWFALAVWTYRDITSRTTNPVTHVFSTLIVVLFWIPGAVIYLILRPRETLDEAFQRAMEEEYLLQDLDDFPVCPTCRRAVRDDFLFCPHCAAELRRPCVSCDRLADLRWDVCAWCGAAQPAEPVPIRAAAGDVGRKQRGQRRGSGGSGGNLQAIDGGKTRRRASANAHDGASDERVTEPLRPAASARATPARKDQSSADVTSHTSDVRSITGRADRDQGSAPHRGE